MATHHELDVQPQRIQLGPEQQTLTFPWYQGCNVRITAAGMIGSGVECTGLTPPGGWGGWPVNEGELDWPCRGGASRRYALIASFDGRNWFFVGNGTRLLSHDPRRDPVQMASLRFAVNRPRLDRSAAGDHAWHVVVDAFEPGEGDCSSATEDLRELRTTTAPEICARISGANHALEDRRNQMWTAFQVAGGFAIALTVVALPVLVPAELAQNAATNTALTAISNALREALPSVSPIGSVLGGLVGPLATLAGTRSAATAVRANASPVGINPFVRIAIIALTIALVAAFAVAIGLALSLLTLGADRDNAISDWNSITELVRSEINLARQACPMPPDETLPRCAALEG